MRTTINETDFTFDEFADGWGWSTPVTESEGFFETAAHAQADAMRFVLAVEAEERSQRQQADDERRFGTEWQQVESEWKAGAL